MTYVNLPWVVIGDFNAIITLDEHKDGLHYNYSRKACLFSNFITSNALLDMGFVGSKFTWCNNRPGLARHRAWLDRCLVNSNWTDRFDSYFIKHLPCIFSDHAPILLIAFPHSFQTFKIFRFENYWLDYIGCTYVVKEAWNFVPHANPMHAFAHLVARTRSRLLNWRINCMNSLESDLINTKSEIHSLETDDASISSNEPLHVNLQSLYNKYSALQRQNSTKWAQRA